MVIVRSSKNFEKNFSDRRSFSLRISKVNFVRQLILLCLHLIFLTTAIFLRSHNPDQHIVQKIFCHIAEVCVVAGCALSIFALQAKEIYLQGFNYYLQNLVKTKTRRFLFSFDQHFVSFRFV